MLLILREWMDWWSDPLTSISCVKLMANELLWSAQLTQFSGKSRAITAMPILYAEVILRLKKKKRSNWDLYEEAYKGKGLLGAKQYNRELKSQRKRVKASRTERKESRQLRGIRKKRKRTKERASSSHHLRYWTLSTKKEGYQAISLYPLIFVDARFKASSPANLIIVSSTYNEYISSVQPVAPSSNKYECVFLILATRRPCFSANFQPPSYAAKLSLDLQRCLSISGILFANFSQNWSLLRWSNVLPWRGLLNSSSGFLSVSCGCRADTRRVLLSGTSVLNGAGCLLELGPEPDDELPLGGELPLLSPAAPSSALLYPG